MQWPIKVTRCGIWVQLRYIYGCNHPEQEDYELVVMFPWSNLEECYGDGF